MICPNCKCEYIRGVKECADCGVALVDAIEESKPAGNVRIVSVWEGNDPSEFERVKAALGNAGIEYLDRDSKNFDLFIPLGSKLEIWVSTADRDAAGIGSAGQRRAAGFVGGVERRRSHSCRLDGRKRSARRQFSYVPSRNWDRF